MVTKVENHHSPNRDRSPTKVSMLKTVGPDAFKAMRSQNLNEDLLITD